MRIDDMLPICEKIDSMGYWSAEVWGGATFDSCIRFLGEGIGFETEPDVKHVQIMVAQLGLEGARGADTPASKDTGKNMENALDLLDRDGAWLFRSVSGRARRSGSLRHAPYGGGP